MPLVIRATAGLRALATMTLLLSTFAVLFMASPSALAVSPDAWRVRSTTPSGVSPPALPSEYTPAEVDALVAPLDEREARALLIEQLKAQAARQAETLKPAMKGGAVGFIQGVQNTSMMLGERVDDVLAALAELGNTTTGMFRNLTDAGGWPWRAALAYCCYWLRPG